MKLPGQTGPNHFVGIGMSGIAEVLINPGDKAKARTSPTTPTSSACAKKARRSMSATM